MQPCKGPSLPPNTWDLTALLGQSPSVETSVSKMTCLTEPGTKAQAMGKDGDKNPEDELSGNRCTGDKGPGSGPCLHHRCVTLGKSRHSSGPQVPLYKTGLGERGSQRPLPKCSLCFWGCCLPTPTTQLHPG